MMRILPVLLSGGSGSRLWPLSRENYPKQLLPLLNDKSLLQNTILRLQDLPHCLPPLVILNENHRFLVAAQLQDIGIDNATLILEPASRNTAPAIATACLFSSAQHEDVVLVILPADHIIKDSKTFCEHLYSAATFASQGNIVTLGIKPTAPHTGYGYIQCGESIDRDTFKVSQFTEKPDLDTAKHYLSSGEYVWNSGMIVATAKTLLEEFARYQPSLLKHTTDAMKGSTKDLDFIRLEKNAYEQNPDISMDYAILEKSPNLLIQTMNVGWSDIGSWSSLWEAKALDSEHNCTHGDVVLHDVKNSYIHSTSRLITVIGLDNTIIMETSDAILVANKDRSEEVKLIAAKLKSDCRAEVKDHKVVHRPWGNYESISDGKQYKVKRIIVRPGASLSLQEHRHRAEHWIVARGIAHITKDDEQFLLYENQSTYIAVGTKHRLSNPGKIPLELIEVQTGSYLEEDDIIRHEDIYGRDSAIVPKELESEKAE